MKFNELPLIRRLVEPFRQSRHSRCIRQCLKRNEERQFKGLKSGSIILTHIHPSDPLFVYHEKMLGCRFTQNPEEADAVLIWGTKYFKVRHIVLLQAIEYDLPLLLGEDGFIRSMDLSVNGAAGMSCIVDGRGVYYDSGMQSTIDYVLNSEWVISDREKEEALKCLDLIKKHKISKYNIASPEKVVFDREKKYKSIVLVIDQRAGDQSIAASGASASTFKKMLADAIEENPGSLILVKTHPDSGADEYTGYYTSYKSKCSNVVLITQDLNPVCLLEAVDKVYVVSSQMGMEALFLDKEVYCYGEPVYSGWGLTVDRHKARRRRDKKRTLLELFFVAYIKCTCYYNPEKDCKGGLSDVLLHIGNRNKPEEELLKEYDVSSEVTVVIKTFERPSRLIALVKSIRDFYPDVRIVVVDDSKVPLNELWDENIHYIFTDFDVGLSRGRNIGVKHVKTPYVLLLDDDFLFSKRTKVELLLRDLRKSGYDLVAGNVVDFNEKNEKIWDRTYRGLLCLRDENLIVTKTTSVSEFRGYPRYDIVLNFFLAKTSTLRSCSWDDDLKIREHECFFGS